MKTFNINYHASDLPLVQQFGEVAMLTGFLPRLQVKEKPIKPRLSYPVESTVGKKERAYLRTILRSLAALRATKHDEKDATQ
jgi:hypothetical protein